VNLLQRNRGRSELLDDGQDHAAPAGWVALGVAIASLVACVLGQPGDMLKSLESR
jgi:hypothetical protein